MSSTASQQKVSYYPSVRKLLWEALGLSGHSLHLLYLFLAVIVLLMQVAPHLLVGETANPSEPAWTAFGILLALWLSAITVLLQVVAYRVSLRWFVLHPQLQEKPSELKLGKGAAWKQVCLKLDAQLQAKAAKKQAKQEAKQKNDSKEPFVEEKPSVAASVGAVKGTKENKQELHDSQRLAQFKQLKEQLTLDSINPLRLFRYLIPGLGQFYGPVLLGFSLQGLAAFLFVGLAFVVAWLMLGQPDAEALRHFYTQDWRTILKPLESTTLGSEAKMQQVFQALGDPVLIRQAKAFSSAAFAAWLTTLGFQALTILWLPYLYIWRSSVLEAYRLAVTHWRRDFVGMLSLIALLGIVYVLFETLMGLVFPSFWALLVLMAWHMLGITLCMVYVLSRTGFPTMVPAIIEEQEHAQREKRGEKRAAPQDAAMDPQRNGNHSKGEASESDVANNGLP